MHFTVNGRTLWNIDIQKDLGAQGHSSLKEATQLAKVMTKADDMFAFISRALSIGVGKSCCRYIKPWLDSGWCIAGSFWSPHYQMDVEALERVERRFTRMLPGLESVGYEERLNN